MGHLGSRVSALLDGRLDPAEEERAWAHVHSCHPCRDLVEREGWIKTRLAGLSMDRSGAPDGLKHSLRGAAGTGNPLGCPGAAWPRPADPGGRRGLLVIGGGAAGVAVVGVLALGAATGSGPQIERRAPVTELNRPVPSSVTDRPQPPARRTHRPPRSVRDVVVREKMDW